MKWIGQHIWDSLTRFRSDVYLESISSGTIASGGNLGLDSNNKIVKATDSAPDADASTKGIVELATTAETTTGTDTTRAVTPDGLKDGYQGSTNVTTLGTITTGTWQGTAIGASYVATLNQDTTGQAGTVATIAGLAPNTATTQATQPNITTLAGLTSLGAAGATTDIAAGDLTMYNAVNDGNPTISLGSSSTNRLEIKSTYNSGDQTLDEVVFTNYTTSSTANDGRFKFYVDEVLMMNIADAATSIYGSINSVADGAQFYASDSTASSATQGGKLILQSDDGAAMGDDHRLGVIEFKGAEDASNNRTIGARIEGMCDAAWSASENGGRLDFYTTDGNATESKVLTLDSDKLATFAGAVSMVGVVNAGNDGIIITDTTTSSATQGGRLRLIADDDQVIADNHRLGVIEFQSREVGNGQVGYSATGNIQTGARIQAIADAAWSASENGASLEFYTTDGDASESVVLTLDSDKKATFAGSLRPAGQVYMTHHNFNDDINTGKIYLGLADADSEQSATTNIDMPLVFPTAGKLLKVILRANSNLSGITLTWRLETQATGVTLSTGPTVVGTQSGAGCTNSSLVTYDFTTGLDSGDNIIDAGDMVYLSIQANSDPGSVKYYVTCVWEVDFSSI